MLFMFHLVFPPTPSYLKRTELTWNYNKTGRKKHHNSNFTIHIFDFIG